jgi:hypothetical protein
MEASLFWNRLRLSLNCSLSITGSSISRLTLLSMSKFYELINCLHSSGFSLVSLIPRIALRPLMLSLFYAKQFDCVWTRPPNVFALKLPRSRFEPLLVSCRSLPLSAALESRDACIRAMWTVSRCFDPLPVTLPSCTLLPRCSWYCLTFFARSSSYFPWCAD